MRKRKILLHLFFSYLLIVLLAIGSASWYASRTFRKFYIQKTEDDLTARALLIQDAVGALIATDVSAVDKHCKKLGNTSSTRITIILPSGKILSDSEEDPAVMDNHLDRPEVVEALSNRKKGSSIRYSHTLKKMMMYVALPIVHEGDVVGIVRTATPLLDVTGTLLHISTEIIWGGLIAALVAAIVGFLVAQRITLPLAELREGAERFSMGEFNHKLAVSEYSEIGAVADSMNRMAEQLDQRIKTIIQQRNEQEAVLSSLMEGVVAVDSDERIININLAACRLLGIKSEQARERSVQEVVRNSDLQQLVRRVLSSDEPVAVDFVMYAGGEKYIHSQGTPLRNPRGQCIGAVLVLNDVTDLRRLENVRRDFVANVSHELKTPITSIKGFSETLLTGALENRDDAQRFVSIIAKQADRLNSLIDDLLTLAKIEEDAEKEQVIFSQTDIRTVIESAIQACEQKILEKRVFITATCPEDISASINAPLIEQALINLIDNAVKYSEIGGAIRIEAGSKNGEIVISVSDYGCGIAPEHLPRLFERFYRVDKARSRKLGGTGLGLAIVKHIVQAHGGAVSVESSVGKGSVFSLHLPKS